MAGNHKPYSAETVVRSTTRRPEREQRRREGTGRGRDGEKEREPFNHQTNTTTTEKLKPSHHPTCFAQTRASRGHTPAPMATRAATRALTALCASAPSRGSAKLWEASPPAPPAPPGQGVCVGRWRRGGKGDYKLTAILMAILMASAVATILNLNSFTLNP